MPSSIFPNELGKLLHSGKGLNLVDVRTPGEYRQIHVQGARNIPLHELQPDLVRSSAVDEPVYVICQQGGRGRQACLRLAAAGITNVFNIEGGTDACAAEGLPVVRGQKSISLERQVRMAAGSLVLVGILLAWLVHPWFAGISALVGGGLLFSGLTDTCGMGMLLARMPWNRAHEEGCRLVAPKVETNAK